MIMKIAALVIAATVAGTSFAAAQSVEFRAGPSRDGVYVDRDHVRDRDWRDSHNSYRERGDTVVIKKRRSYDDRAYDRDYDHPRPGVTLRTW
jgi:Ni/Co efflux regulator RcnB